jgi:acetyl-CoA carboxylase biotin carboxyl carrier protein
MKLKELEELIAFIAKSGLEEVNIETEQIKLRVKKNTPVIQQQVANNSSLVLPETTVINPITSAQVTPSTEVQAVAAVNTEHITFKSPMIGTFYRASNPNNAPFVQEGDTVKPGQPLCIIEAMKLFNEIEAETAGTIVKILVEDASPVEYDQPLFLIKPA